MALTYDTWGSTSSTYDGLTGTYNAPNYPLATLPAAIALTGVSAFTSHGRAVVGAAGLVSLTGSNATALLAAQLQATQGSYAITGQSAETVAARQLQPDAGGVGVAGESAQTLVGKQVQPDAGSYAASGADGELIALRIADAAPGAFALAGSDAQMEAARLLDASGGFVVVTGFAADLAYSGAAAEVIGMGFEMGGKPVREVQFKPLLERIMEARAERIKPAKKLARAKARVIEGIAAELAMNDGGEKQFRALMDEWLAQSPVLPDAPDMDVEQMFMAQVALRVQRMQAEREAYFKQDEEDALLALLA